MNFENFFTYFFDNFLYKSKNVHLFWHKLYKCMTSIIKALAICKIYAKFNAKYVRPTLYSTQNM